jgi:hypothetical protein
MIAFMPEHFGQGGQTIGPKPSGNKDLCGIDSDRAELSGVVHPRNARNRKLIPRI